MNVKCGTLGKVFLIKTGCLKRMGIFFKDRSVQWLFEDEKEALSEITSIVVSNDFKGKLYQSLSWTCSAEKVEDLVHDFVCHRIYGEKRSIENLRYECKEKSDQKVLIRILFNKVVDYIKTKLREESCPNWKRVSDDVRDALMKLTVQKDPVVRELEKGETEYQKKFVHGEKVFVLNGKSFGGTFPVGFEDIASEIKEKYGEIADYLRTKKGERIQILCSGVIIDMAQLLAKPFTVTDITSILMRAVPDGFTAVFSMTQPGDGSGEKELEFADRSCSPEMADFGVTGKISEKVTEFIEKTTDAERDVIKMCLIEEEVSVCEKNRKLLAEKYDITTRTVRNYEERLKVKLFKHLKDIPHEERLLFTTALLDSINGGVNE